MELPCLNLNPPFSSVKYLKCSVSQVYPGMNFERENKGSSVFQICTR